MVACVESLLKTASNKGFNLCRKDELIYLFNGEYWENIEQEKFKSFLSKAALEMDVDKFDAKYYEFKNNLFDQFLSDANLEEIESNNDTTLINLSNGTFEITAKQQFLRKFQKNDFLTYQLPFDYDKDAKAPEFQKFLNDVLPEKEQQQVLAEYLGSIFINNEILKIEKVLLLHGSGSNGKGVIFEIIYALLGRQNITNYTLDSLTKPGSKSRIKIVNKLLNFATETNGKLKSDVFKTMASGEPLEIERLYKPSITSENYARLLFSCNQLPSEVENTHGFFRRLIILHFDKIIPDDKQDVKLPDRIIQNELSGVFNWVLSGLRRLLKNQKFTKSEAVNKAVQEYRTSSDSVLLYLEEMNYKPSLDKRENKTVIYQEYNQFCCQNGNYPLTKTKFYKRMEVNGFKVNKEASNGIRYIYLERKN